MKQRTQHEGKKYLKPITGLVGYAPDTGLPILETVLVDVYDVLLAFGVGCPARQHAIKKLLNAGVRGKGTALQDLIGADAAVSRAIDIQRVVDLANSIQDRAAAEVDRIKERWMSFVGVNPENGKPVEKSPEDLKKEVAKLKEDLRKKTEEHARVQRTVREFVGATGTENSSVALQNLLNLVPPAPPAPEKP